MRKLQTCTIPEYIVKVKTSNSRNAKYYNKYSGKGKSKTWNYDSLDGKYEPITKDFSGPPYKLPAPKTKLLKVYTGDYQWRSDGYLEDKKSGNRIIANPRAVGTPNYEYLSGNNFINSGSHHLRSTLKNGLKKHYKKYIVDQLEPFDEEDFPICIFWYIYTLPDKSTNAFDLSNLYFYRKYFEDALFDVDPPIIPDDNIKYITSHRKSIIPVDKWEDRKFVFEFFTDDRSCIINHEYWQ